MELLKLLRKASYRLRPFWYTCWRNFGTISGTPSFDLDFDLESQMPGQRSWLCRLLREDSYRFRPFGRRAGVISGRYPVLPVLTSNLTLKVKCQVKGHGRISCSGRLAIVWDHFGTRTDVISGRYLAPRRLTLHLIWKVKCQVKDHGRVSCSGRLAIFWDDFGKRAGVISGRYPVPRRLTLNYTWKVKCQVKCHGCAVGRGVKNESYRFVCPIVVFMVWVSLVMETPKIVQKNKF